jgi:hypothetical protein
MKIPFFATKTKVYQAHSKTKVMLIIFFSYQGDVYCKYTPQGG